MAAWWNTCPKAGSSVRRSTTPIPGHHGLHDHGGDRHRGGVAPIVLQNELRNGTLRVLNVKPAFPPTSYCAYYLESPSSRLAPLIASIAYEVRPVLPLYDDALVCRQSSGRWLKDLRGGFAPAGRQCHNCAFRQAGFRSNSRAGGERTHIRRIHQRRGRAYHPDRHGSASGRCSSSLAAGRDRAAGHRQPVRYRTLARSPTRPTTAPLVEPARVLESSLEFTPEGKSGGRRRSGSGHAGIPRRLAQVISASRKSTAAARRVRCPRSRGATCWHARDARPNGRVRNGLPADDSVPQRSVVAVRATVPPGHTGRCWWRKARASASSAESNAQRQEILRDARMLAPLQALLVCGARVLGARCCAAAPQRRPPSDDLTPLDAARVPSEVALLVDAVNHHIARHLAGAGRAVVQFLADASHQKLRTPLAIGS